MGKKGGNSNTGTTGETKSTETTTDEFASGLSIKEEFNEHIQALKEKKSHEQKSYLNEIIEKFFVSGIKKDDCLHFLGEISEFYKEEGRKIIFSNTAFEAMTQAVSSIDWQGLEGQDLKSLVNYLDQIGFAKVPKSLQKIIKQKLENILTQVDKENVFKIYEDLHFLVHCKNLGYFKKDNQETRNALINIAERILYHRDFYNFNDVTTSAAINILHYGHFVCHVEGLTEALQVLEENKVSDLDNTSSSKSHQKLYKNIASTLNIKPKEDTWYYVTRQREAGKFLYDDSIWIEMEGEIIVDGISVRHGDITVKSKDGTLLAVIEVDGPTHQTYEEDGLMVSDGKSQRRDELMQNIIGKENYMVINLRDYENDSQSVLQKVKSFLNNINNKQKSSEVVTEITKQSEDVVVTQTSEAREPASKEALMENLYNQFKNHLEVPDELNIAKIENILSGRRGDDLCDFIKAKKTDLNPIKSVLTSLYEKTQSTQSGTASSSPNKKRGKKGGKKEGKKEDNSKEIDNLELLLITLHIYGFELNDADFLGNKKFSPCLVSIVGERHVKEDNRKNSDREINFSLVLKYLKDGKLASARKEIEENRAPEDPEKSKSDRANICLFTLRRGLSNKKYSMLDAIKGDEFLYARGQALRYLAANASNTEMDMLIAKYIKDDSYKFHPYDLEITRSLRNCRNYNPMFQALLDRVINEIDSTKEAINAMLIEACAYNNINGVNYLLSKNADPTICDNTKHSALTMAAYHGSVALLEELLKHKDSKDAFLKHKDGIDATMITAACTNGRVENVEYLLEQGADPTICDDTKYSALTIAASKDNIKLLEALLAHTNSEINHKDGQGLTMITSACANGRVENVKYLLKQGADPTICNNTKHSALTIAASIDNIKLLEALLTHKDNKDAFLKHKDEQDLTMITSACANKRVENVKYLLEQGADPTICDDTKYSALTITANIGNVELLEALLTHQNSKDYINHKDGQGLTMIAAACAGNKVENGEYLLKQGADPTICDNTGHSALTIAANTGNVELLKALLTHKNSKDYINHKDEQGLTMIAVASELGDEEMVLYLLEQGADPTICDNTGHSALTRANNNQTLVSILRASPKQEVEPASSKVTTLQSKDTTVPSSSLQ